MSSVLKQLMASTNSFFPLNPVYYECLNILFIQLESLRNLLLYACKTISFLNYSFKILCLNHFESKY